MLITCAGEREHRDGMRRRKHDFNSIDNILFPMMDAVVLLSYHVS